MCGIVGILSLKPALRIEKTILDRMVSAIAHRGPDGKGSYLDNWVGLGHCRLSIVDIDMENSQYRTKTTRSGSVAMERFTTI